MKTYELKTQCVGSARAATYDKFEKSTHQCGILFCKFDKMKLRARDKVL